MSEHKNCHVNPVEKALEENALVQAEATFLGVSGMGCPNCATRVRNGLLNLDGVLYADVYLQNGVATVAYDPQQVTTADLVTAVTASGNDGRHEYRAHILQTMPARDVFTFTEVI
ncbi:MAG: heavy-metal-associated domain-containing protein [Anaerolinea sp.]|nr:heavy-metal-associated domain-containing protein [Anaerolinea sp.]